jgi:hypothetical protein
VSGPFTGPAGVTGLNPKAEPTYGGSVETQRLRHTAAFLGETLAGPVLDIGPVNGFSRELGERFGVQIVNTDGDFDYSDWRPLRPAPPGGFGAVFAFEVIEHMMNPLLFLTRLREHCGPRTRVFVTYPLRPRMFWSDFHWHEIDRRRFRFLLEQAGYEPVRYREVGVRREWSFYFTGLRPFLRLTVGRIKLQMHELKLR